MYYSYQAQTGDDPSLPANERGMIATQMRSANLDGTDDILVYRAVYYERSGRGPWDAQYFGSFVRRHAILITTPHFDKVFGVTYQREIACDCRRLIWPTEISSKYTITQSIILGSIKCRRLGSIKRRKYFGRRLIVITASPRTKVIRRSARSFD